VNAVLTGLPLAGKTCLFDALSGGAVDSAANPARPDHPNAAMVVLPDARLDWLAEHYRTPKRTPVQIEFLDLPGLAPGRADLASQNTAILEYLRRADVLVDVLKGFESSRVPGRTDPKADLAVLHGEFLISDLDITLRRIEKLEKQVAKPVADREALRRELEFLGRCRLALEAEQPLHGVARSDAERNILRGFAALTEKPVLTILNVGEDQAGDPAAAAARQAGLPQPLIPLCASLEAEMARLAPEERPAFMKEMGLDRLRAADVVLGVHAALNRITFFTAGEKEAAARSVVRGTTAPDAAGEVHTDIAKGFIRAEVVTFENFKRAGGLKQARAEGHARVEGRDYVVQDGDIILFHFSR
jgi:GTP-binding protein YchF